MTPGAVRLILCRPAGRSTKLMPGTIFDRAATDATARDAEVQRMLDVMRALVQRGRAKPAPTRRRRPGNASVLASHQFQALADVERWCVVQAGAWREAIASLEEVYGGAVFGLDLMWRASRDAAHRVAAIEGLPEVAHRLRRVLVATRRALAAEVIRTLPGGSSLASQLEATHSSLGGSADLLDQGRSWLLDFWHRTDPPWLAAVEWLPDPTRTKRRPELFGWAAFEVAGWLERHHPHRRRIVEHIITVLDAGGWTAELGDDPWLMPDKVAKALAREASRRRRRVSRFFER
jgi:hypothetical protein